MKRKKLLVAGLAGAGLYAGSIAATKVYKKSVPQAIKPYFAGRSPYIFAHRGGLKLAPEHTMAAFKQSAILNIDGFEIDIRLTKDDEIVVLHDELVDRVSNGSGKVSDHTLEELRNLDFGYKFKDINGDTPYRGSIDAKIVTLKELITSFPEMRINIDIKDAPGTKAGQLVPSLLYRLIHDLNAFDQVLVTSFHDEQIKRFSYYAGDKIAIGAGTNEVRKAFYLFKGGYGHMYTPQANTFQLPVAHGGIRLDNENFIQFLQEKNIAVGYWVINSIDEMDQLIKKGAHTIVTDRPDIAMHLIEERYRKTVKTI